MNCENVNCTRYLNNKLSLQWHKDYIASLNEL